MIQVFVDRFMAAKEQMLTEFQAKRPEGYEDLFFRTVLALGNDEGNYGDDDPDSSRITKIDHGDYQGTLLFIVAAKGYQPHKFWATVVSYGSCSGCDTLQGIAGHGYDDKPATLEQAKEYWTLCLHMVQKMKVCGDSYED